MENFNNLGLPQPLVLALEQMKFDNPTPIQAAAIPVALEGKDILGSAQTGTGKTAAFAIPLIAKLLNDNNSSALILTPTRELATQVTDTIRKLIINSNSLRWALLIGGEAMPKQFQQLRSNPRIVIGTPGRINDHLQRGSLKLNNTNFLVLDETDRMLDMGFGIQLERIAKYLPAQRQTLMFSATLPHNIVNLSKKYLNNPERISIGSTTAPIAKIKQELIHTSQEEKYNHLLAQLEQREGSVIVFVKTKRSAEKIAQRLVKSNQSADAIHGDLRQNRRDRVIKSFRNKNHRVMVATDIAARGLDIPHIEHVINYDLPQCPEDYIHRIGRTARAGAEGSAVCLISPDDNSKWRAIHRLMNPSEKFERSPEERSGGGKRRGGYQGRSGKSRWSGRSDRSESRSERGGRSERFNDSERPNRSERFNDSDRPARTGGRFGDSEASAKPGRAKWDNKPKRFNDSEKPNRSERFYDAEGSSRSDNRSEWSKKPRRFGDSENSSRPNRSKWAGKPRRDFNDSDKPARSENGEKSFSDGKKKFGPLPWFKRNKKSFSKKNVA